MTERKGANFMPKMEFSDSLRGENRFWAAERKRLKKGQKGTRNWSAQQRKDILNNKVPKLNGDPIEGHHKYNVIDYPQLADDANNIYPATFMEHFMRWHGGNYQNDTSGVPINPLFKEEF